MLAMDSKPAPFVPPAPTPRTSPPSLLEMIRIVYRNPLELWGEPSYNEPWISVRGVGGPLVIANDPALIRHVLVDNAKNYKLATVRQMILRPILRDGLLTAEGEVWKRSRKAMAPVFTPRHIFGFAEPMLERTEAFAETLRGGRRGRRRARHDHAHLRHPGRDAVFGRDRRRARAISPRRSTVCSRRWAGSTRSTCCGRRLAAAHHPAARPQDHGLLPPHRRRYGGHARSSGSSRDPAGVPQDFLTLLLNAEAPDGLTRQRDRGQHHHLHRRRPRDHRAGARLDHLSAGRGAVGARAGRGGDRRGAGGRARSGQMARKDAVHPRRLRGGAAALSAGAFDQPRADRR